MAESQPRYDGSIPSYCDDASYGDSMLSHLERELLDAIAREVADPLGERSAERALVAYVEHLRERGAPPEAMLLCVKKVLGESAIADPDLPQKRAVALHAELITRSIAAYYRARGRD
jgi:hypothetical protein